MSNDQVKGKLRTSRVESSARSESGRRHGAQVKGAAKQVEGKVQNAWGKAKDAVKKPSTSQADQDQVETDEAEELRDRAANE